MVGIRSVIIMSFLLILILAGALIGSKQGHLCIGALIGLGAFLSFFCFFVMILFLAMLWQPALPACQSGKCKKYKDYILLKITPDYWLYQCGCGTKYILKRHNSCGRKFMKFISDDKTKPYMERTRFGRWKSIGCAGPEL